MINYDYYIWVEIEANKKRIIDRAYFERILEKCAESGIGSIILSAKDTTGFGIYKSSFVPHYSKFDNDFEDIDYLDIYTKMAHEKGMKLYAAVDVFAEGWVKKKNELSPGFINTSWQTHMYGIDEEGQPSIRPITDLKGIKTVGSIDDFCEVFVNPIKDEVRDYETKLIKEIAENYDVDGVVLDRVRFVGLGSDFSDYTRGKFEEYLGHTVENWPEDIYKLIDRNGETEVEYGSLFGKWTTFKAGYIKKFILEVKGALKTCNKNVEFIDYTGSWYPLYYLVGANWAKEGYIPEDYPWVGTEYADTGYAQYIDKLLSGFYYEDVTIDEALANGKPHYWYSVEGSADMLEKVVEDAVPYIGSLFVKQYENNVDNFKKAVDMCFKKSKGCMIFDLCYIDDYKWWEACKH